MSQVKLTIRANPNVDFIIGYPGIPPVEGVRAPAAIKGTIEVRAGGAGAKAKWVRVELRKIETLPGGGQTNTFFDIIGSQPATVWTAGEDYGMLQTQDLAFNIRIPESLPPSITLEKGAGIKYELIASVHTKGKGSWFRRAKPVISATMVPVIIDKHELHSTWPVYCQPEMRKVEQHDNGVTLIVERNQTCYGPGDRVSVIATLKTDDLHTVILRGFEFMLKETTVYRAGAQARKAGPQVKTVSIGEQKVPVNATLYGGTQNRAELTCQIPKDHTTTSINAARHIDITYILCVKALMGTGAHVLMDMPVIISNWPRVVSIEAVKRIGVAPNLSVGGGLPEPAHTPYQSAPSAGYAQQSLPSAAPTNSFDPKPFNPKPYNTVPNGGYADNTPIDEFGGYNGGSTGGGGGYGYGTAGGSSSSAATTSPAATPRPTASGTGTGRRPQSAKSENGNKRFTVTNYVNEPERLTNGAQLPVAANDEFKRPKRGDPWPDSGSEKERLYNTARGNVERTQGNAIRGNSPESVSPPRGPSPPMAASRSQWPTAEEEKLRLFNEAQARAQRTQGGAAGGGASTHSRNNSYEASSGGSGSRAGGSSGATANRAQSSSVLRAASPPMSMPQAVPHYPSADQEKAALRAYEAARRAVDRNQGLGGSDDGGSSSKPIAYESLYPAPAVQASQPRYLTEKQRLERDLQARDAAAAAFMRSPAYESPPPPAAYSSTPPQPSAYVQNTPMSATSGFQIVSEKEALARKYAAEEAQARAQQQSRSGGGSSNPPSFSPTPPPPRATSSGGRPPPMPPVAIGGSNILSAIDEKALLRAKYDAEANGSSGSSRPYTNGTIASSSSPPPPPPLMPRPPAEYIQETRAEDRLSRAASGSGGHGSPPLPLEPFTPFGSAFENGNGGVPPPPLLPRTYPQ